MENKLLSQLLFTLLFIFFIKILFQNSLSSKEYLVLLKNEFLLIDDKILKNNKQTKKYLITEKMALHRNLRVGILNIRLTRCWSGNGLSASDEFIEEERVEIEKVILKNTEISQAHLTPELKLHLLTPNCHLYNASAETIQSTNANGAVEKTFFQDPFWSIYWPGGQVLTRFILDMGIKLLSNKFNENSRVLDLGSGCGASAIAAKLVGARQVLANDIDPGK